MVALMKGMFKFAVIQQLKQCAKLYRFKCQMKSRFPESYVEPENIFPIDVIESIGDKSYGFFKAIFFDDIDECKIKIGSYCSIGQETTFILGGEHFTNFMSTFPFDKRILAESPHTKKKGNIIIGDDVWIGYGATILSGVTVGQGAVVGAKSVVTKDVPPYAIWAGDKVVKFRFSESVIEKLVKINYKKLTEDDIRNEYNQLQLPITDKWFVNNSLYKKLSAEDEL